MTDRTFIGMKIEGDSYRRGQKQVQQRPKEDLAGLLTDVLLQPGVLGLAWDQYTPYFNDGEPCVFRVNEVYISVEGINPDKAEADYSWQEEDGEANGRYWLSDWGSEFARLIGDGSKHYLTEENGSRARDAEGNVQWVYKNDPKEGPNPPLFAAYTALTQGMDSGAFDHALLELFGDHARLLIDAKTQKIMIEEVEHD